MHYDNLRINYLQLTLKALSSRNLATSGLSCHPPSTVPHKFFIRSSTPANDSGLPTALCYRRWRPLVRGQETGQHCQWVDVNVLVETGRAGNQTSRRRNPGNATPQPMVAWWPVVKKWRHGVSQTRTTLDHQTAGPPTCTTRTIRSTWDHGHW